MPKLGLPFACLCVCMSCPTELARAETLIHSGDKTSWSFKDDGEQPGENWIKPDFDDSRWRRGVGPFGFGEDGIATEVSKGDKAGDLVTTTTYFRTAFEVVEPQEFSRLCLNIRADDGCIAYLNGRELVRWNMPPGKVTADSYAAERLFDMLEQVHQRVIRPAELLVRGTNLLAIELHQAGAESTDAFLDVTLVGITIDAPALPHVPADAREVTRRFSDLHYLGPDRRIPDGFLDGGRHMQVDEFGYAVSGRELLGVDRRRDDRLRTHLQYAQSDELKAFNELDRATRIARYVDRLFTPPEGRAASLKRDDYLVGRYPSEQIPLGDVALLCGAGVCRHRSLLFKLMADEADLKVALVRGTLGSDPSDIQGHTWNELFLSNGKRVIVDVMNPQPDFYFPEVGEASLRGYRTVAKQPKYRQSTTAETRN